MQLKRHKASSHIDKVDVQALRDVAVRLVSAAARELRRRQSFERIGFDSVTSGHLKIQTKSSPTDVVTRDDTDIERLIRRWLEEERPTEPVVGEEAGGAIEVVGGLRWVIDPIDGTTNYVYGIPSYAVSVAAQIDGQTVAGAVADVTRGVVYSAALGRGSNALISSRTIKTLNCNEIRSAAMALVGTGFGTSVQRRAAQGTLVGKLVPHVRDIRNIGSAALDLCMVATGQLDAQYEHGLSIWDWAAGALIAAEAGAWVRIPASDTFNSAGEIVAASAPGIAFELDSIFETLRIFDPLPAV